MIDLSKLLEMRYEALREWGKLLQPATRGAVVFTRDTNQKKRFVAVGTKRNGNTLNLVDIYVFMYIL